MKTRKIKKQKRSCNKCGLANGGKLIVQDGVGRRQFVCTACYIKIFP